jgi:hypothetical protein
MFGLAALPSAGSRLEDGPSDLGPPAGGVAGVVPVDRIELPEWPVDGQSVAGDVAGQGPVRTVDAVLVRAVVRWEVRYELDPENELVP